MQSLKTIVVAFNTLGWSGVCAAPYRAYLVGEQTRAGYGRTPEEAIGQAVILCPERFPLEAEILRPGWGRTYVSESLPLDERAEQESAQVLGDLVSKFPDLFEVGVMRIDAGNWPMQKPCLESAAASVRIVP